MIDFDFGKDCCGCTACANSCTHGAITMKPDEEDFLMPVVDKGKCVDCGLCNKVCPHLNTPVDRSGFSLECFKEKKAYLYFSNDKRRKESASGGFVYDIYKKILGEGGLICGCVWDEDMEAVHIISDSVEDMHRMQSSKYVQSNMGGCFAEIRNALREGRKVAFCGTPCQTAGLDKYLGKVNRDNLISIGLICHGVPSPGVWGKWKSVLEKKYKGQLVNVNMRDKSYKGYQTSYVSYTLNSVVGSVSDQRHTPPEARNVGLPTYLADPYIFLFTDNLYLRHSCNHCQYKADKNGADIIVGDYYLSTPEAGNQGCSSLFAMTDKGNEYVHSAGGTVISTDYRTIGSVNSMLWESIGEHPRRSEFFDKYRNTSDTCMSLFTDFLPFRFKVKKLLNQTGLFGVVKKLLAVLH